MNHINKILIFAFLCCLQLGFAPADEQVNTNVVVTGVELFRKELCELPKPGLLGIITYNTIGLTGNLLPTSGNRGSPSIAHVSSDVQIACQGLPTGLEQRVLPYLTGVSEFYVTKLIADIYVLGHGEGGYKGSSIPTDVPILVKFGTQDYIGCRLSEQLVTGSHMSLRIDFPFVLPIKKGGHLTFQLDGKVIGVGKVAKLLDQNPFLT